LGSNYAESTDTFPLLFGHFVGGTNVFSPDGDGLRIRIRVGPANGTWTTYDSSFQAGFDLIHHNPWPFYASALSGSYPLNDYRNSTFYGYNAHIIHHLDAPLPVESTPGTPSCRFIRIDIGYHSTPLPEPVGLYTTPLQFGRLMIGLARVPGVQHGSGISTPIGAPPRSRVSWSLDVDRDEM